LISSLDTGGFKAKVIGISENLRGTSFFVAVTILHELVHYGRYWNGLSQYVDNKYEAGQVFETNSFDNILGIIGSSKNAIKYGW